MPTRQCGHASPVDLLSHLPSVPAQHHFPGTRDKTFLDAACVGLAPTDTRLAIERFLDRALLCPDRDASTHHIALDQARVTAVREGARLLDAGDDEIALVESTTHGLNVIAAAIPFQPHENVVICDLEFLQVAIPWLKLAERGGIREVRVARNRRGAVPVEAFAQHVDADTRAVVVSSVQWTNGFAVDLHGLAEVCRAHGALLVVDAIQQLGATRLSVRDTPADIVVAGGHYDFPTTAKSLEINGTANYPGAVGLGASLELVNKLGITTIEAHVHELTDRLHDELPRLGVRVVTRPEPEARSGITTFEVSDAAAENEAFLQALLDERIYVAMRYTSGVGGIRVSTHLYNDHDDVDRLIQVMRSLLGRGALQGVGAPRGSGVLPDELRPQA